MCPFQGLAPFQEADAAVFHGRRVECAELVNIVAHNQWSILVGPSGSGKSSLALAGVVPRVREDGTAVAIVRPATSHPLRALAAALLPLVAPDRLAADLSISELAETLAGQGLPPVVAGLLKRTGSGRLLIVVDQFDEVLASGASLAEVGQLAGVLFDHRLPEVIRVLTILRSDALDAVLAHPGLGRVFARQRVYTLGWMDAEQLREVVVAPVDSASGLCYESGLMKRILEDVGTEPGALSSLSLLLQELWRRRQGGVLTHQAYNDLGGVTGILIHYVEEGWARCVQPENAAAARRLLTRLVRVPWGTGSVARRVAQCSELAEDERDLAYKLAGARLLVISHDAEDNLTMELAHAALITGWPRLAAYVAEGRQFLAWRESLHHDIERWERSDRAPSLLPAPETMNVSLRWLSERGDELTVEELAYLEAGRVQHRWRRRWWIWAAAAVSSGLLIGNRLDGSGQATPATAVAGGVCMAAFGILGYMLWRSRRLLSTEPWHRVVVLALAAALGYALAYLTGQPVLARPVQDTFSPSDTAQIVTAIGAMISAVGMSAAAVIKAVALLIHARNDTLRARAGLPAAPPVDQATPDQAQGAENAGTE
ncbi:nSTAND1 domain-containing NTPase [Streptomyces rochei]|uniref:nSTAND1 domain-containing NTPase n=1 Tax=Streptomyces rochei TaxID=1928 RepID=UPI003663A0FC